MRISDWSSDVCSSDLKYPFGSLMPGQELPEGFGLKADTLAELAAKAGIAEDGLAETIAAFNGYCETGDDLDFKRGTHPWGALMCGDPQQKPNANLGPLLQAPFYEIGRAHV